MINRRYFLVVLVLLCILSCKKDKKSDPPVPEPQPYVNRYPRPWKTQFISFENIIGGECGNPKNSGYKLFYKDTLLQSACGTEVSKITIGGALVVNDSIMHLFMSGDRLGFVSSTMHGGYSWIRDTVGGQTFIKFHPVNHNLVYCISSYYGNSYYIGATGKSGLNSASTINTKGRIYFSDLVANVNDQDSTVIGVTDSLTFVVKFK